MRRLVFFAFMLGGCAVDPSSFEVGPVSMVVPQTVAASVSVNAVLRNHSGSVVHVGAIGCYVETDRWDSGEWKSLGPRLTLCIQLDSAVATGTDFPFNFFSPAESGTYRLRTYVEGDSTLSGPFTVR